MNIETSRIESISTRLMCAFCCEVINEGEPATKVVRHYFVSPTEVEFLHPTCSIDIAWSRKSGHGYHHYSVAIPTPKARSFTYRLYPADTPTAALRMDAAYKAAELEK